MREFKVGDKVLVEVKIIGEDKRTGDYQVKPVTNAWTFWTEKGKIHPLTAKDANVPTKTYEDGLSEAWKTARLIELVKEDGGLADKELIEIFGTGMTPFIFRDNTAQEAAAKIAEWEGAKEICVGDVVKIAISKFEGVVSKVKEEGCYVILRDGSSRKFRKKDLIKTGRTFDIAGLLAQIGGTE